MPYKVWPVCFIDEHSENMCYLVVALAAIMYIVIFLSGTKILSIVIVHNCYVYVLYGGNVLAEGKFSKFGGSSMLCKLFCQPLLIQPLTKH